MDSKQGIGCNYESIRITTLLNHFAATNNCRRFRGDETRQLLLATPLLDRVCHKLLPSEHPVKRRRVVEKYNATSSTSN